MASQESAEHRAPAALEEDVRIHQLRTGACQSARCKDHGQTNVNTNFALQWCCCGAGAVVAARRRRR
eukprot:2175426-Lingulodinium_polyedra.AAC.1